MRATCSNCHAWLAVSDEESEHDLAALYCDKCVPVPGPRPWPARRVDASERTPAVVTLPDNQNASQPFTTAQGTPSQQPA